MHTMPAILQKRAGTMLQLVYMWEDGLVVVLVWERHCLEWVSLYDEVGGQWIDLIISLCTGDLPHLSLIET